MRIIYQAIAFVLFSVIVVTYVTNVSAKKEEASKDPRISRTLKINFWKKDTRSPPPKRSRKACSIRLFPMTPKYSRLTKASIEHYLIKGRRVKTPLFLVLYATIPSAKCPQVSVTVSKKIAKTAVLRNRLRRRGYAALASLIPSLPPTIGVLVSYTQADTKISLDDIRLQLKDAFRTIH